MPDLATDNLEYILATYTRIPSVPLFDAHDEYDAKGQLLRKFGKEDLEEIAERGNRRARETGDLAPFGPGHTVPGMPEELQPPIWGYLHNYRVGHYGPAQRLCILADLLVKPRVKLRDGSESDGMEAVKELPRRSVEVWYKSKLLDWVALLKRTPQRDLGLLAYGADANSAQSILERRRQAPWTCSSEKLYADENRAYELACASVGGKLRYSMENDMADPVTEEIPGKDADPAAPPDANEPADLLAPEDADKALKYMKHCYGADPLIKHLHGKYAAEAGLAAPGAPSGTNTFVPGANNVEEDDKRIAMAKDNDELVRYQKETNAKIAELQARAAKAEQGERIARYSADLQKLEADGYAFDLAEELVDCQNLSPEAFEKFKERIVKRYQKAPIGGSLVNPLVPTAPGAIDYDTANKAKSLATREKIPFNTALERIRTK